MALPASVPVGTVTGTWYTPSGGLAVGTIIFLLMESVEVPDDPDGVVLPLKTIVDIPAGVLNRTFPAGIYAVSIRLSELYRESKIVEITAGQALNLPDAVGMVTPNDPLYTPVRTVEGIGPDGSGNIDLPGGGGGGVTDHGELTGLADDDHTQYYTTARLNTVLADYVTDAELAAGLLTKENTGTATAAVVAHVALSDPHVQYLKESDAAPVATLGTYASLTGKPTIPVASDDFPVTIGQFNSPGTSPDFSRADHAHSSGIRITSEYIKSGNISPAPDTGGVWRYPGDVNGLPSDFEISIPAEVGDWVEISINAMRNDTNTLLLDTAVKVGSTVVLHLSSGTATPAIEGDPSWYQFPYIPHAGPIGFVVEAGHLDGSNVRFVLSNNSAGAGILYASTAFPFYWQAKNLGPVT